MYNVNNNPCNFQVIDFKTEKCEYYKTTCHDSPTWKVSKHFPQVLDVPSLQAVSILLHYMPFQNGESHLES